MRGVFVADGKTLERKLSSELGESKSLYEVEVMRSNHCHSLHAHHSYEVPLCHHSYEVPFCHHSYEVSFHCHDS